MGAGLVSESRCCHTRCLSPVCTAALPVPARSLVDTPAGKHDASSNLGGRNVIVQIDESLFRHKPKYHRGRAPASDQWVFVLCDTSTTPGVSYKPSSRSSSGSFDTVPSSTATSGLPTGNANVNYTYATVDHSENSVDPVTGVHTQAIESYWVKAKQKFKAVKGVATHPTGRVPAREDVVRPICSRRRHCCLPPHLTFIRFNLRRSSHPPPHENKRQPGSFQSKPSSRKCICYVTFRRGPKIDAMYNYTHQ